MADAARVQKVADQIQKELATLIQLEINDPRIGMVSVTGVRVSRDLAYADVYVTVLNTSGGDDAEPLSDSSGEEVEQAAEEDVGGRLSEQDRRLTERGGLDALEIKENIGTLNRAAGYLRSLLARRLRLRTTPKLKFHYDDSLVRGQFLSALIDDAIAADEKRGSGDTRG